MGNTALEGHLRGLITEFGAESVLHESYKLLGGPGNEPKATTVTIDVSEAMDCLIAETAGHLGAIATRIEKAMYKPKGIPAEFIPVIQPDALRRTLDQIDAVAGEVVATGKAREDAYGNKAELVCRSTTLETDIRLAEAEAFMKVNGNKVTVNGVEITLSNDTNRDAYRRQSSATERKTKAENDAEIAALDVGYRKADDAFKAAVAAQELVTAKAHVQAALLNFLSTRA